MDDEACTQEVDGGVEDGVEDGVEEGVDEEDGEEDGGVDGEVGGEVSEAGGERHGTQGRNETSGALSEGDSGSPGGLDSSPTSLRASDPPSYPR